MTTDVLFDQSLPRLVGAIRETLGDAALGDGVVLRDATGRLSFIAAMAEPPEARRLALERTLCDALGGYARADAVLQFSDRPAIERLRRAPDRLPLQIGPVVCHLIDRRIVGAGWVAKPAADTTGPPRIVFSSLKGGVGRTTALAVAAADLAGRNNNVLVVDLDLEAPGIGTVLLDDDRCPPLGTMDFLVENGIGGVSDARLDDFVATSALTSPRGGRVNIVPALGARSAQHPENVLGKLSRAMIDDIGPDGGLVPVASQVSTMIDRLAKRTNCDIVLIDACAGLAELAAPPLLQLGAIVLLFGTADRQTIAGYRHLFAWLRLLAQRDRAGGESAPWRHRFQAVHSKASLNEALAKAFHDNLYDLFAEYLYDADDTETPSETAFSFDIDDDPAPHRPLLIPYSQDLIDFDPLHRHNQLTRPFYEKNYRPFLDGIDELLPSTDVERADQGP